MKKYLLADKPIEVFSLPTLTTSSEFIVFDSHEEWDDFLSSRNNEFNLDNYKSELTKEIQKYLDGTVKLMWYDSMDEVPTCNVIGGKWEAEAKAILLWNSKIWEDLSVYFSTNITEENKIPVISYVNNLISFNDFNR